MLTSTEWFSLLKGKKGSWARFILGVNGLKWVMNGLDDDCVSLPPDLASWLSVSVTNVCIHTYILHNTSVWKTLPSFASFNELSFFLWSNEKSEGATTFEETHPIATAVINLPFGMSCKNTTLDNATCLFHFSLPFGSVI